MDLNEILIFTKVVQAGSFTRAAKLLGLPKSTVSRKIRYLEDRLGVRLLNRTTRSLRVTETGAEYFDRCSRVISEIEDAETAAVRSQEAPQGTLRITAPVEMGMNFLAPIISDYVKLYPKVDFDVVLTGRFVDLVDEGFDIGIRIGELEDSSLVARRLGLSFFQFFASPDYLRKRGAPTTLSEVKDHDSIHFSGADPVPVWTFEAREGKRKSRVQLAPKFSVNSVAMVRELAISGHGIAPLPIYLGRDDVKAGLLRLVLKDWMTFGDPIHAVYPSQRHVAPKVRTFVDFLAERMKAHPWFKF